MGEGRMRRRVERLESLSPPANSAGETYRTEHQRVRMKVYLNAMAEARGKETEPLTEEEQRIDLENERHWLEQGILSYRREPGWSSPECQAVLDQWEEKSRKRLQQSQGGFR